MSESLVLATEANTDESQQQIRSLLGHYRSCSPSPKPALEVAKRIVRHHIAAKNWAQAHHWKTVGATESHPDLDTWSRWWSVVGARAESHTPLLLQLHRIDSGVNLFTICDLHFDRKAAAQYEVAGHLTWGKLRIAEVSGVVSPQGIELLIKQGKMATGVPRIRAESRLTLSTETRREAKYPNDYFIGSARAGSIVFADKTDVWDAVIVARKPGTVPLQPSYSGGRGWRPKNRDGWWFIDRKWTIDGGRLGLGHWGVADETRFSVGALCGTRAARLHVAFARPDFSLRSRRTHTVLVILNNTTVAFSQSLDVSSPMVDLGKDGIEIPKGTKVIEFRVQEQRGRSLVAIQPTLTLQ